MIGVRTGGVPTTTSSSTVTAYHVLGDRSGVMISMAPTNPRINEEHDAVEMLAEFTERLAPSRNVTRERKAYRDAMGQGKGVIEMNDNKAINEIALIAKEIYGEIQIETRSAAGAA